MTLAIKFDPDKPAGKDNPNWVVPPVQGQPFAMLLAKRVPGSPGPGMHTHNVDQFHFILEGKGAFKIGTETFEVTPGAIISLPAGLPHDNWAPSGEVMTLECYLPAPGVGPRSQPALETQIERSMRFVGKADQLVDVIEGGVTWSAPSEKALETKVRLGSLSAGKEATLAAEAHTRLIYTVSGEAEYSLGDGWHSCGPHWCLRIPAGQTAEITNMGSTPATFLLVG